MKETVADVLLGIYDLFLALVRLSLYPVLVAGVSGIYAGVYLLFNDDFYGLGFLLVGIIIAGLLAISWKPAWESTKTPRRQRS